MAQSWLRPSRFECQWSDYINLEWAFMPKRWPGSLSCACYHVPGTRRGHSHEWRDCIDYNGASLRKLSPSNERESLGWRLICLETHLPLHPSCSFSLSDCFVVGFVACSSNSHSSPVNRGKCEDRAVSAVTSTTCRLHQCPRAWVQWCFPKVHSRPMSHPTQHRTKGMLLSRLCWSCVAVRPVSVSESCTELARVCVPRHARRGLICCWFVGRKYC